MHKTDLFIPFASNEKLAASLASALGASVGDLSYRRFPDEESYVRYSGDVKGKNIAIVCTLDRPDTKFLPLCFLSSLLKERGAKKVGLIAPYLAYMRQDKAFQEGEALSSHYFAKLLSQHVDWLVTVDPHLHRIQSLEEIYSIPTQVLHASSLISEWVRKNVQKPLLIGPDEESGQWVSSVAKEAGAPFTVLKKVRKGDRHVEVSIPHIEEHKDKQIVLIDDIASSGHTMLETIKHLRTAKLHAPICIVVHPVFAGTAYEDLKKAGAKRVLSCNTIEHVSNGLDIAPMLVKATLR